MENDGKLKIPYPVIVEGKYDRLRVLSVIDAQVLTTDGFGIFKKREKLALFRALSQKTPIVVLTDPDGAGKLIRSHISTAVPKDRIIPLYVPQITGKEARKKVPSAAGFLGVEGQEREKLYALFLPLAAKTGQICPTRSLTKADFFEDGLTGCEGCAARRAALAGRFDLPADMTPNALLAALNVIATYEEYKDAVRAIGKA